MIEWRGNDHNLIRLIRNNRNLPKPRFSTARHVFNMNTFGRSWGNPNYGICGTEACLVGNDFIGKHGHLLDSDTPILWAEKEYGITHSEALWLFCPDCARGREGNFIAAHYMLSSPQDLLLEPTGAAENVEFWVKRVEKFLAYKRRKNDLIELDQAIQQADRELLRRQQKELAAKAT